MDTAMSGFEAMAETLPKGYRAREFRDTDREPWVEERNAQIHEVQRGTADEWREWERIDPPNNLVRVSVDAADGRLAAGADLGPGFFPRTDGTLFGGANVMRAHRRKGLGKALLEAIETEARKAKARASSPARAPRSKDRSSGPRSTGTRRSAGASSRTST